MREGQVVTVSVTPVLTLGTPAEMRAWTAARRREGRTVALVPTIALATVWLDDPLHLGLEPMQMVLLAITAVVSVLTVVPGRAKPLNGGVHLVLLASFVFLSLKP